MVAELAAQQSLPREGCVAVSPGVPARGALAVGAVRDPHHQRLQNAPGQGAVHPEDVLHHHEPAQPGQRGLRAWG